MLSDIPYSVIMLHNMLECLLKSKDGVKAKVAKSSEENNIRVRKVERNSCLLDPRQEAGKRELDLSICWTQMETIRERLPVKDPGGVRAAEIF